MRPKDTQTVHSSLTLFFFIMSKQVLISMLRQGNTGNEILSILDAITSDAADTQSQPVPDSLALQAEMLATLQPIEF